MAAIAIAFGASLVAGASAGLLYATRPSVGGVRPRRLLREHRTFIERISAAVGAIALIAAVGGVAGADRLRWTLGPTCAAAALLVAIATWLLFVEPDDGGEVDSWGEPHWWPQFEQDLADWTRRTRIPAGPRS